MKTLTIRLTDELIQKLNAISTDEKQTKSDVVREAIERHVALKEFKRLRKLTLPFAEMQGLLTDEDIFESIS